MNAPVSNSIAAIIPELTEWRRDFHRHPELSYDVPRTARLVAERLGAFGFDEVIEGVGRTGVLGVLHGAAGPAAGPEKRVLFRADMDALADPRGDRAPNTPPRRPDACTPAATTATPRCCSARRGIWPRRAPSTGRWSSASSRPRKATRAPRR